MMKAWTVKKPGSLENLQLVDLADPGAPAAGEIRVALHATSLNYHDLLVATGVIPTADRRILMADGAGVVEAVGAGVNEFQPGDRVVAGFFPQWLDGRPGPLVSDFSQTPGDGAEGSPASMSSGRPAILPMRLRGGVSGRRQPSPPPVLPPGARWSSKDG